MRSFDGRRVFVTGGSTGIGRAMAAELVAAGAHVLIAARRIENLDRACAEITAAGGPGTIGALSLDVGDRAAVRAAAPRVLERLGGLDVLINNAGLARPGRAAELSDEVFEEMMRVNYFGTVDVTRALLPHFRAQGHGHICNVSSLLGLIGVYGYSAYAASKFALVGFTDCLRQELLADGIGVSLVFPPDTDTPQVRDAQPFLPPETDAVVGGVGTFTAETVAHAALSGILAGRYHTIPGAGPRFRMGMYRIFPRFVRRVLDAPLRKNEGRSPVPQSPVEPRRPTPAPAPVPSLEEQ